jgi:hypothetical protein
MLGQWLATSLEKAVRGSTVLKAFWKSRLTTTEVGVLLLVCY